MIFRANSRLLTTNKFIIASVYVSVGDISFLLLRTNLLAWPPQELETSDYSLICTEIQNFAFVVTQMNKIFTLILYFKKDFELLYFQVKVWFQNRRTKYKRMKQEEAESGEGGKTGKKLIKKYRCGSRNFPKELKLKSGERGRACH